MVAPQYYSVEESKWVEADEVDDEAAPRAGLSLVQLGNTGYAFGGQLLDDKSLSSDLYSVTIKSHVIATTLVCSSLSDLMRCQQTAYLDCLGNCTQIDMEEAASRERAVKAAAAAAAAAAAEEAGEAPPADDAEGAGADIEAQSWPCARAWHAATIVPAVPAVAATEETEGSPATPARMLVFGGQAEVHCQALRVSVRTLPDAHNHHHLPLSPPHQSGLLNDVWELNLETFRWSEWPAPEGAAPSPRANHTATYFPASNQLVVFGG